VLLSDYVAALKGGWRIILGILVVAIALSFIPTLRSAPVFASSTDLFVAASANTNDPEELYQRNAIATQRIASYVTAASGDVVAEKVAQKLGRDLDASVVAEAVPATVVIRITATGSDAEQVRDVAAAYAEVLPGVIDELEEVGDETSAQVRVSVVDRASLPVATPRSFLPNIVLGLILGLGLGVVIVMLRETLRREQREARAGSAADEDES
jgi:succinoglycan biosynthesis transport protein ExoP